MDPTDAKLVAACQQGDRCAQQQLFDESHGRIFRLMARMVGEQDAADVTQQVYLQVYRQLGKFSGRSRLSTWIYRLAVNEALQHLRRRNRKKTQTLEYEPIDHVESHESRSDLAEVLEAALADLEVELRTIFLLREVEELPYNAIADVLDIPEGTVGSRLNRARRELQQRLTQLGWGP
ncbi:RNA polymerase sigma factor [Botrimarina mediterranea]|uniref:RNA polymerase sigma factor n=1 Tax=Botrimarina mediterranea TaxID=2528022 RepID=UPI001188C5C7|nr:ECF RNA polymerase sigma-E factor [Planctomycetes bacterium K2D]